MLSKHAKSYKALSSKAKLSIPCCRWSIGLLPSSSSLHSMLFIWRLPDSDNCGCTINSTLYSSVQNASKARVNFNLCVRQGSKRSSYFQKPKGVRRGILLNGLLLPFPSQSINHCTHSTFLVRDIMTLRQGLVPYEPLTSVL